jgi:DNA polymerase III delta prime subunit
VTNASPDSPAEDSLDALLRAARPGGGSPRSLERRLAVGAIVAAAGSEQRRQLGRLEVQARIGGGAMGVVYRAYDPQLQRLVAVKLLRGWTEAHERLQIVEEARRLAQLTHPNVVAVYDIVNDEDGLYFTMEYVAGMTLRAWLDARPDADFREVLEWFVQAGRGLMAAHEAGMVHRDFKPENVIVGENGRARVVDFGLAHVLHDGALSDVAGTPYYMAPEVCAGAPATPASDQFGFCTALRDALAQKDVPAQVRAAVERGLSVEPGKRYASVGELVDLLSAALAPGGDERPRALLLERVERLWLHGVLERSLGDGGLVDLALVSAPNLVEPPWRDWKEKAVGVRPASDEPDARSTSSRRLPQLLADSNGSLLLVGPPGAGKTTLLLQLCRDLWRTATLNPGAPAPAVLSLSTYRPEAGGDDGGTGAHFQAWVIDELVVKYGLPRPAVRRWFDESGIVLLLDGLDETDSAGRIEVVRTLNRFREQSPLCVVVTCRDSEYAALGARLAFGAALQVEPLDDGGMSTLLDGRHAVHLVDRLGREPALREQLRNPLLLTLYANRAPEDQLADNAGWASAYEPYVQDALRRAGSHERDALVRQLAWLAGTMRRQNTSDLWLERLNFGWLERPWERRAGYLAGVLLVAFVSISLNLAQLAFTEFRRDSALVFGVGVWLSSFAYTRGRLTPIETLRWSGRRALRLLPVTTVCAMLIGLVEALRGNFMSNIVGAGFTGAILAGLLALEPSERAVKVRPNAGVSQSLANSLLVSFGAGIPVGLAFSMVIQPYILRPLSVTHKFSGEGRLTVGVAVGTFVFTAMFLIYGGFVVVMHYVLRLWLAWRTPLPLGIVSLLDRAVDLGLMRRVGGGYVFLHRTLLDYFAERDR